MYRAYIGWSSTTPRVTATSLAHRDAALRGTFLCLLWKHAGEGLRVNHHTCASEHRAWALWVNTKRRHLLNFHEVYQICGISGVRPLGSQCHRLKVFSVVWCDVVCSVVVDPTLPFCLQPSACASPSSLVLDADLFLTLPNLLLATCSVEAPKAAGGKFEVRIKPWDKQSLWNIF